MNESVTVAAEAPRYDFRAAEPRWQRAWAERGCFRVADVPTDDKPKYYVLEMFPYPSGKIHMGHVRNYTLGDVVARYKRARGFAVMHPMGWDAFGLPAENAARERGIHPAKWTWENIAAMRAELQRMGLSLEWEREFATCDPAYYGHQQKLFLDFLRAGLVERKESWVNWDPVDGTVLANEQVIDGRGWRSGAPVEKKQLSQWFLKITDYAQELLDALDTLDRWPERVRLMQANWIGRSEGARLTFAAGPAGGMRSRASRSTPRVPTRCSACRSWRWRRSIRCPPRWRRAIPKAAEFVAECRRMGTSEAVIETAEKRGYDTGLRVRHPFLKDATFPVWIANFVLMEYGTGAIFGCPAHDQRDLDFARKYGLERGAGGAAARRGSRDLRHRQRGLCRPRHDLQFGLPEWPRRRGGQARGDRRAGASRRRQRRGELAAARLGREPAALLGLPDPGDPLRRLRRGAGAGRSVAGETARRRDVRPAGQSAGSSSDLEARRLPALRRRGAAGDRHVRHLRRQLLVFRALLQPAGRRAGGCARRSITGCRSISISAASSTRSCICCIRASSPAR